MKIANCKLENGLSIRAQIIRNIRKAMGFEDADVQQFPDVRRCVEWLGRLTSDELAGVADDIQANMGGCGDDWRLRCCGP